MSEPLGKPIQQCRRTPKKFLRKGEGLKRFAAYRPPLPVVAKKHRQTVVKFDLDKNEYSKPAYLPDLLFDDSINLSTEIPKIAPPKIMHTPIKPPPNAKNRRKTIKQRYNLRTRRPLEAVVERHITPSPPPYESPTSTTTNTLVDNNTETYLIKKSDEQIKGKIDNLMKKIEEKKNSLEQENIANINNNGSPVDNDTDNDRCRTPLTLKANHKVKVNSSFDLSTPSPGNFILALGKHIQRIENTVNELKEKMKNCNCGAETLAKKPRGRLTRKAQAARLNEDIQRPSANADNQTPDMINCLADEIAKIKQRMDGLNLGL